MRFAIALAALLVSCGSTQNRPAPERPSASLDQAPTEAHPVERLPAEPASAEPAGDAREPERGASPDVVARVAGQPILASELLSAWLHRDSPEVRGTLEELVLSRMVVAEARRLGVELPVATVDTAYEDVRGSLVKRLAEGGSALTPEDFVRDRLGLDPERYFARLREETTIDLLAERVVRAWLLESDRAEVRVIVLRKRDDVDLVQTAIARGDDFAGLADEHNPEGAAGQGGRIPPVVRGDAALSRLAFSTPTGEVGGPILEGGQWLFLRVDSRPGPVSGPWTQIGATVEASLRERPIEDPEYWQWKAHMIDRYEVDMEPFLELVGETVAR